MWKKVIIAIIMIGIIGGGYYYYKAKLIPTSKEQEITTIEQSVSRGDIRIDFVSDGEAEIPITYTDFEMSGKVSEILVKVGDKVEKGDILAKLESEDYENQLKSAEIAYEQALLDLEKTKEDRRLNLLSEKQKLENLEIQKEQSLIDQTTKLKNQEKVINEIKRNLEQTEKEYLAMLELEDTYSKQEIENKRIAYEEAKENYEYEKESYELLKQELENEKKTLELDYENQKESYNSLVNDEKDIRSAELKVESSKQSLDEANKQLENTVLKAQTDGEVLFISKEVGETAKAASDNTDDDRITSDTQHFILMSLGDTVYVETSVSELDLSNVSVNQEVEVEFEAFEGKIFTGKVVEILSLPQVDNNGVVTYDVKIKLDDPAEDIRNGMTCTISFIIKEKNGILIIPNEAVKMIKGQQVVNVKNEDGAVIQKEIVTGFSDGENVEVIEGLALGDIVVIQD